ncbi:MAG TPA: hypothetical protein VM867_03420 [Xanthobacteraceae bacterium]|nr:hypothetical protein [Xanthobacteraceae bacterium]
MIIRAAVAAITLTGLALALAAPALAQSQKNQKKSYIYYRAEDRAYFERTRGNRLTVRPRSYLSAGTETKQHEQHYTDYAFPPGGSWDYQHRNSFQGSFTRMPLNDPWDVPGSRKF